MVVAAYADSRAKIDAQKNAAHTAQFHIRIRQYYTGSTKLNYLFSRSCNDSSARSVTKPPRIGP